MTGKQGGRPTKITTELTDLICGYLAQGHFFETACALANCPESTAYEWLHRAKGEVADRPPTPETLQFAEAIKKASAEGERKMVDVIRAASVPRKRKKDDDEWITAGEWQAAAWFLERRFPQRWGRKVIDQNVNFDGRMAEIHIDASSLSDEELAAIVAGNSSRRTPKTP